MIPTFAVVGHPNKGKSSIVATLAEDEQIPISPMSGTTRHADRFTFSVNGEPFYQLVDTPGFQRPKAVLDWLYAHERGAGERPELVRQFIETHRADPRFADECMLLTPIVEGAGILYVVDGTKPYGAEFEIEMEVLRWTGQPRMALINLIGDGDYLSDWRQALEQYFSIVRVFDAMRADFSARLNLLRAFGELQEAWRPCLERAIETLQQERARRLRRSAWEIASALIDCLLLSLKSTIHDEREAAAVTAMLRHDLQAQLRRREQQGKDAVQAIYRHERLARVEEGLAVLDTDLFARESWELFGLSRTQLVVSGAISGAIAGLGLDAAVGGASLLLGSGIGALIGGVSTWFGSDELAKIEILGDPLGGRSIKVGPVSQANFPWVLLGRAWVHHQLVRERNHALRDALSVQLKADQNLVDKLPDRLRRDLTRAFARLQVDGASTELISSIEALVEEVLGQDPLQA